MNVTRRENERKLIHHYNRYSPHDRDSRIQTFEEASILHNPSADRTRRSCSSQRTNHNAIAREPFPIPPLLNLTSRGSNISQDKKDSEREIEKRVNLLVEEVLAFISTDIEG